jgi:hypothetical protein
LRDECYADDVEIDDRMYHWTEKQVLDFFASGGDIVPAEDETRVRRLHILCLHSFRTNSAILETQMNLKKQMELLADVADFSFLNAPYACNSEDEKKQYDVIKRIFPTSKYGPYREWFNARVSQGGDGSGYVVYDRLDESISCVRDALCNASPPFDGIMGFSQGGSLALHIAALQEHRAELLGSAPPLRFVWLQSCRLPRDHSCLGLFETPVSLPSFVNYNEDDSEVKSHEMRAVLDKLAGPVVVCREKGGHSLLALNQVPEAADKLRAFLQERQRGTS